MNPPAFTFDEEAARRLLLVRAYDGASPDDPLWTPEDRSWATRLAVETTPAGASPGQFLLERARHALQRLLPRDPVAARLIGHPLWRRAWLAVAVSGAALLGLIVDELGPSQHINLLAPPIWALVAWNLCVYALLVGSGLPRRGRPARRTGLRTWLASRLAPQRAGRSGRGAVLQAFGTAWAGAAMPLVLARAALLLHAAAAALALGLIGGLYVRGLVFDYRAGWQSTFLGPTQVHAVLAWALAPASALTGIGVPDAAAMQALRIGPDAAPVASAAPWLHLYAVTLGLFVVLPRSLLALGAGWRARRLARDLPLPMADAYFQRLLREWHREAAQVQVMAHGAAPAVSALAGLRTLLATALGGDLKLQAGAVTAHGDEDRSDLPPAPPGTSLRVLLVDLATTPEDEAHGRWVAALRRSAPGLALLLVADETAWCARFVGMPQRLAERRAAWQRWADAQGIGFISAALDQPDPARAGPLLERALGVDAAPAAASP